jgi:hypothetical protein
MRKIAVFLFIVSVCFALNHTTTTYIPVSGNLISASGLKANYDSLKVGVNQTKDTVNCLKDTIFTRSIRAVKIKTDSTITADSTNIRSIRAVKSKLDSTLTVDSVNLRSITINDTGWFPCTTSGFTVAIIDSIKWQKIGRLVTLSVPSLSGTSNQTYFYINFAGAIPAKLKPVNVATAGCTSSGATVGVDNGTATSLIYCLDTRTVLAGLTFQKYNNGAFTNSGTKGLGIYAGVSSRINFTYLLW